MCAGGSRKSAPRRSATLRLAAAEVGATAPPDGDSFATDLDFAFCKSVAETGVFGFVRCACSCGWCGCAAGGRSCVG